MYLPRMLLQPMLAWVLGAAVLAAATVAAAAETSSGCPTSCGDINIMYPFGTNEGCYMEEHFHVTCDHSSDPHKLYLNTSEGSIEITDILLSGELHISSSIALDCYNKQGLQVSKNQISVRSGKFPISITRNKFIAIGCDTYGVIEGFEGRNYSTGCLSQCDSIDNVINSSCSGIGCCEKSIPKEVTSFKFNVSSHDNHTRVWEFNPCSYAFVAEENNYTFSSVDLANLQNRSMVPVVLDWAVGNQRCDEAKKNLTSFACKANSDCYDFDNGPGYRCNCSQGYEGNPYSPNGCTDIDECVISSPSPCNITCHNLPGTYSCSCPEGYEGDGRTDGSGCSPIPDSNNLPLIKIALGISISVSLLLLGASWLYWGYRQRNIINLREKFFQQNGGIMLQQQLSIREGSVQPSKIFTAEDLKKATNNYHESRILGQGGQGTVYKGELPDNTVVAIKKSKVAEQSQSQIEQFINEVIVLSQVNHRNVVRLLGCCLETQVPLLVYEFITNGTLYDHIHTVGGTSSITWENRLRIATETAAALSYLHSAASTPIIHRDVKSTNILLDNNYVAKVSDFGSSRLIPVDQTQLTTLVQGTLGYLDPEYFQTSQLTERSDVYSFGVVLVELLTGKKAISFDRPEADRNLAMYFISAMKEDRLFEIVDEQVINDAKADQLEEVAILTKRCLRVKGDERPTMKEVAMELEGLRMMEKNSWLNDKKNLEETQYLLGDQLSDAYSGGTSMSNSAACDSIANHVMSPFHSGR
ncbi:Wall-associated receptor kinase 2 [Camellia lanceoleosa]|uniref:Wall-associated receptor kinase 2 n=1 Tax=Camellia lanceoleosa TaxID=1840588 RepID=A0ACC0HQI8_9ERIC|nr:Wall-associated receptor kinase 2 [Camellia lanceoleosa]